MTMMDIICKKRDGAALSDSEIAFLVRAVTDGSAPDYQIAAWLMASFLRGLDARETAALTREMARSGDMLDLSAIDGVKADKHSTGGVGDKTTLIVAPIVAACGVKVAKMSGRGLGHTGGTVDKLASIPGFRTELTMAQFIRQVNDIGICLMAQTGNLTPADKKLYALRDVTGTVESLPLIAASIMSKKIAAGADVLVLDVKVGSGAFMKNLPGAMALAEEMVHIAEQMGKRTLALITDMEQPLGQAVGNAAEVAEAVAVLQGNGPGDVKALSLALAADMLHLAGKGSQEACEAQAQDALSSGRAYAVFRAMVAAQGGDAHAVEHPGNMPLSPLRLDVCAEKSGFVTHIDGERIGRCAMRLGAGREKKEDVIDLGASVMLAKKTGDAVTAGEVIASLYTREEARLGEAAQMIREAYALGDEAPPARALILARVQRDRVAMYEKYR